MAAFHKRRIKIINVQSITLDQMAVHQTRFLSEHKETPETLHYRRSLYGHIQMRKWSEKERSNIINKNRKKEENKTY